jgi:hypothetical protein
MNEEQLDAAPSSTEPQQPAEEAGNVSAVAEESATEAVTTEGDDPNADASPVADQSESDTASSAPPALSEADIAGGQLTGTGSDPSPMTDADLAAQPDWIKNAKPPAEGDAGNSPGVSDGSGIESRIMALLHVARAAMVTLEQDVSRNVHAALDGIEQLVRKG